MAPKGNTTDRRCRRWTTQGLGIEGALRHALSAVAIARTDRCDSLHPNCPHGRIVVEKSISAARVGTTRSSPR